MKPKSKGVILLESQPPHMGEFLQILSQLPKYDTLYVCFNATPSIMPVKYVLEIWQAALQPYAAKVKLITVEANFVEIMKSELPEVFEDCIYLTADRQIFVHLSTMNVSVELVPRALGYNSTYLRVAYRQSRALDWLENRFINSTEIKDKR